MGVRRARHTAATVSESTRPSAPSPRPITLQQQAAAIEGQLCRARALSLSLSAQKIHADAIGRSRRPKVAAHAARHMQRGTSMDVQRPRLPLHSTCVDHRCVSLVVGLPLLLHRVTHAQRDCRPTCFPGPCCCVQNRERKSTRAPRAAFSCLPNRPSPAIHCCSITRARTGV